MFHEYTEILNNARARGKQNPTLLFKPLGDETFERSMVLPFRESFPEWRDDKEFTACFACDVDIAKREES